MATAHKSDARASNRDHEERRDVAIQEIARSFAFRWIAWP
jgi:hypothetical protein